MKRLIVPVIFFVIVLSMLTGLLFKWLSSASSSKSPPKNLLPVNQMTERKVKEDGCQEGVELVNYIRQALSQPSKWELEGDSGYKSGKILICPLHNDWEQSNSYFYLGEERINSLLSYRQEEELVWYAKTQLRDLIRANTRLDKLKRYVETVLEEEKKEKKSPPTIPPTIILEKVSEKE